MKRAPNTRERDCPRSKDPFFIPWKGRNRSFASWGGWEGREGSESGVRLASFHFTWAAGILPHGPDLGWFFIFYLAKKKKELFMCTNVIWARRGLVGLVIGKGMAPTWSRLPAFTHLRAKGFAVSPTSKVPSRPSIMRKMFIRGGFLTSSAFNWRRSCLMVCGIKGMFGTFSCPLFGGLKK